MNTKKEQSSRKQNDLQHKKEFNDTITRGEMLQKVAQKKSAPERGEISESARKCEQKKGSFFTRYAREQKALIFRVVLSLYTR